jgi:hypothetical protein
MRLKFLIIPVTLLFHVADAQTGTVSLTPTQGTVTAPIPPGSSNPVAPVSSASFAPNEPTPSAAAAEFTETAIVDYKSVYEAPTLEEEVKMATERFNLTKSQQDTWLTAATERRAVEKQGREKLEAKNQDYSKETVYRGLRAAQNTFHETIIGYLTPTQKQGLERDRLILEEKRKRLANVPPPPPPPPTVTVVPVDSAAIKEQEKSKAKGKKTRKKKKAVSAP